jgi:PAS domain S-box-containing protein
MNPADQTKTPALRTRVDERQHLALSRIHTVVLESMAEGVTVSDGSGCILYTNASEDRMFGYGRGELTGQHISIQSAFPDDVNRSRVAEALAQLQSAGEWRGEWLNRKKDGSSFHTSTRIVALTDGGTSYWVWVRSDISDRRRTELDLRNANEALHALIQASPLPIVAFDREGLIQSWNPAAENVFGWTEKEVIGQPLPFIPEDKRAEHRSMRERDLSGESFTGREVRRRRKDGTPIDISVSTAPMYDSAGQITGIMSVYVDVTEQKRVAEEQRRAMQMLRENEAQLTLLVEASGVLLASPHSEEVLGTILELSQRFVHAEAYAVWRKHKDSWRLMASTGLSDKYERTIAPSGTHDMLLPDEPFAVEDVYSEPALARRRELYRAEGIRSFLTVPLKIHGEIAGTIVFYYRERYVFSVAERRVAGALGNLAASALSAADNYEHQIELRATAEAAERRASFLSAVGEELVSSLDYELTLASVAKLAVPDFADWCSVDILQQDGAIQRLAVQHVDPAKIEFAYEFARRYPTRENDLGRVVMRTGLPLLLSDVPDSMLQEHAHDAEHLALLRALSIQSVICVPMVARDRTLGLLTFVRSGKDRSFDPQDLGMAVEIARRSAIAIDNARLFREVRESEERFRRMYESNIIAVAFWNTSGDITAANDAYLQVVGVTREEFEQTGALRWAELTPEAHRSTDEQIMRECFELGASRVYEKEYLRRDGTYAPVLIAAAFLTGRQTEGVAFIVDITERKKLDRQFRGVADAAVAISAARSVTDVLRTVNDRVRQLVSCRRSEIRLGAGELAMGLPELSVALKDRSGKILGAVRLWPQEPAGFTSSDRAVVVQLAQMASIAIENTELNESLRKSNEELQRANEDLNQFAYSASHDLQEPLRMVSIYTQLLERKLGESADADTREFMRVTLDGAKRMEMLIRDLLAYTQAVNIRGIPEAAVDAGAALQKAIANLQGAIESSGAQIRFGVLPSIRAYDIHLVQLFQNLVGNAIKYRSGKQPEIDISVRHDDAADLWIFTVQDNGIGIPARYQHQVFGLFKRLYTAHQYPGTGIGLAICQKVVERYGGRIWVESEDGQGSRFIFTLPS